MPNLAVLMTNHSDINMLELLTNQLPFLKNQSGCLLVECVPNGFSNESLFKYLSDVMLTYTIKVPMILNVLR